MRAHFSPACERNREPIAAVLQEAFSDCRRVLEIGSGTGQHAVYFGARLPHLTWQTSDLPENHASINAWREQAGLDNVLAPLALDVGSGPWPSSPCDGVFSANTCHIMAWHEVKAMFEGVGRVLSMGGVFCVYGPFNYGGAFTSPSNQRFDAMLKEQAPHMGVRDFEAVNRLAEAHGLRLQQDRDMPANNRLLWWRRS